MSLTVTLKAFQLSGFSFAGGTATLPANARTHVGVRVVDNAIVQADASVNVDRTVLWLATCTTNGTDVTLCIEHDPLMQIELAEIAQGQELTEERVLVQQAATNPQQLFVDASEVAQGRVLIKAQGGAASDADLEIAAQGSVYIGAPVDMVFAAGNTLHQAAENIGLEAVDTLTLRGNNWELQDHTGAQVLGYHEGTGKVQIDKPVDFGGQEIRGLVPPAYPDSPATQQYAEEHMTLVTGVLSGCEYSAPAGGNTFSITAGTARIVHANYPSPETHTDFVVPAFTNVVDGYPSSPLTVIGLQYVGNVVSIVQQVEDFSDLQRISIVPLCSLAKANNLIIASSSLAVPSYAAGRLAMDLYRALGPVCSGLSYSGIAGKRIARSAGTVFRVGSSYLTNKAVPNTTTLIGQSPVQYAAYSRNNSNTIFSNSGILTDIDPTKYDDGGASVAGIPTGVVTNNKWQAMRVWVSTNGYTLIQYGTAVYDSPDAAQAGVASEAFYAAPITSQIPFRGLLVVRGGATDFNQATDAVFVNAGRLGDSSSATAGSGAGNVQIQFKDEGASLGTAGTVDVLDFTGSGVKAARVGNVVTVNVARTGELYNKLINGCFRVNQREKSGTVTLAAGAYGHDRWKAGAGGCTYTFATVANVTTITITAGTLLQIIEGVNLRSGSHVLSWTGTAQARIDAGSYGASPLVGTAVGGTNQTIEFGTGTVSSVQYVAGTSAPAFELRPISVELEACQRYYLKAGLGWTAIAVSATGIGCQGTFPVEMRVPPTITAISGSGNNLILRMGGSYETITTFASLQPNGNRGCLLYGTGAGYTVGGYFVMANFAECSAEL